MEGDSWRNASYLNEEFMKGYDTEIQEKRGGRRSRPEDGKRERWETCGWYLGSVLGWVPVCGKAAWILSWCLSCTPALSRCNENKHTLTAITCCLWEYEVCSNTHNQKQLLESHQKAASVYVTCSNHSDLHYSLNYSHVYMSVQVTAHSYEHMHVLYIPLYQQHNGSFICCVCTCNW